MWLKAAAAAAALDTQAPQPPQSRGTLNWSFSLRMALMVVTGSVSPACCCTVFSLRKPSTRRQAAPCTRGPTTPPRAPGKKRACRRRDVLKNEVRQPTANSGVSNCGKYAGQASPAGDLESGDTNSTLASGTAQCLEAPQAQVSSTYGSRLQGQKEPYTLARASRKASPL